MENAIISACLLGIPCRYDGQSKQKFTNKEIEALKAKFNLIPVCPEIYGGLPTPRTPSERHGDKTVMKDGRDVTENYLLGAKAAYDLCLELGCKKALLKEKSPSCGKGKIYDGSFTGTLTEGNGVTAEYLMARGIEVYGESEIDKLI